MPAPQCARPAATRALISPLAVLLRWYAARLVARSALRASQRAAPNARRTRKSAWLTAQAEALSPNHGPKGSRRALRLRRCPARGGRPSSTPWPIVGGQKAALSRARSKTTTSGAAIVQMWLITGRGGSGAAVRERKRSSGGGWHKVAAAVCNNRCKQQHRYADDKQMLMWREKMLSQQMSVFMTAKIHSSGRGNDVFTVESDQEKRDYLNWVASCFGSNWGCQLLPVCFETFPHQLNTYTRRYF